MDAPFLTRLIAALVCLAASAASAESLLGGRVLDATGAPIPGAMVSVSRGDPAHAATVFTRDDGSFAAPVPDDPGATSLRVRRIGYRDLHVAAPDAASLQELRLEREADPAALAAQLPANHWFALVLARIGDAAHREELVRQCTYCHQQGSEATRRVRSDEEWAGVLGRMGRMGGIVSSELRAQIPALYNAAYDPAVAVAALSAPLREADLPPPSHEARRARIDEWQLGGRASMQHDIAVHPDGRVYSVDMTQDQLHRLDPNAPGGARTSWSIPTSDLPLGGAMAATESQQPPGSNARVGPHSIQVAPDGSLWITLALGNQLARFDPATEQWTIHNLKDGYYPHTLRFDAHGRVWFTLAASNHIGMFDPATGTTREIRLPAQGLAQDLVLRAMPLVFWLGRYVDIRGAAAESGDSLTMPVPYGIDIAPDGGVWFSQLNARRIGRIDPESFAVELVETPFPAPRRLRFDAHGKLWIPSFSGGLLARFDPVTRGFETWTLPSDPPGSDTPYALNVDRRSGAVWICGANSDALLRFDPQREAFTTYPLPTRVSYTREVDFDAQGRAWTSNSNAPAMQIEGGVPTLIRIDPVRAPGRTGRVSSWIDVGRLTKGR